MGLMDGASGPGAPHLVVISRLSLERWTAPGIRRLRPGESREREVSSSRGTLSPHRPAFVPAFDRHHGCWHVHGFFYPDPRFFPPGFFRPDQPEIKAYRDASPTTYVTRDDAPFLLIHGDADVVVPLQQSEVMEQKLTSAGVAVRLIRIPGGNHGPGFFFIGPRQTILADPMTSVRRENGSISICRLFSRLAAWLPIEDDRYRRRVRIFRNDAHQEPLPVGGDHVLLPVEAGAPLHRPAWRTMERACRVRRSGRLRANRIGTAISRPSSAM